MANDGPLKTSLLFLATLMLIVVLSTHSFNKMLVTYIVGILGIAGLLLPDWDYFNRDFSRWPYPVTSEERTSLAQLSGFQRFAYSPMRVIAYSLVYGYAMYKWWEYISN
ncbi:signal peptidase complex-like protein DTM1 [Arachis duranensis]|uniref:Signal peptidase complex-like protein DTM1 n=1 Tax=Arachis duranensis TaxID=130453 RepID=A0A6P4BT07_ARADU|nr:signal peptidase complex-like protein DTM1 [Arachis duranensis]